MTKIKINVRGINKVQRKLGRRSASMLRDRLDVDLHVEVQKVATAAYNNAPVDTGALRTSILRSVQREGSMEYIFGSYMEYAQRQEYEHRTKKRFMHRAIWDNQNAIAETLADTIKKHFK